MTHTHIFPAVENKTVIGILNSMLQFAQRETLSHSVLKLMTKGATLESFVFKD